MSDQAEIVHLFKAGVEATEITSVAPEEELPENPLLGQPGKHDHIVQF